MNNIIKRRTEDIRKLLLDSRNSAFVIINNEGSNWENLYYMSGFRGTSGALIVTTETVELILDGRYLEQGKEQSFHSIVPQKNGLLDDLLARLSFYNIKNIACEAKRTSASTWLKLENSGITIKDASDELEKLRRTKDDVEISSIQKAAEIASEAFLETLNYVKVGMTEKEFESLLNYKISTAGGELGFEMIVASGKRSSLPHGRATDKPMETGEWVTVDFGARWNGYFCDITRNFSIGVPDERAELYHSILLEAHKASATLLCNNIDASKVHGKALEILDKHLLGGYFTHGLGHGFGLEVHESPYIRKNGNELLKKGDVVTIEPGVYIDGWGGLRIEDDYLITESGSIRLTNKLEQELFQV